jgi:hypothetical protein
MSETIGDCLRDLGAIYGSEYESLQRELNYVSYSVDALAEKAAALDGLEAALPISDGFSLFVAPGRGYEVRSALDGCELGSGPTLAAAIADALKESDTL